MAHLGHADRPLSRLLLGAKRTLSVFCDSPLCRPICCGGCPEWKGELSDNWIIPSQQFSCALDLAIAPPPLLGVEP